MIRKLTFESLKIPFRLQFNHHSAERAITQAVLVRAHGQEHTGYGEGCPREYVTNESLVTARDFFETIQPQLLAQVVDLSSLMVFRSEQAARIRANHAAWCAVEMALLDLFAKEKGVSVEELLGLAPLKGRFLYTGVIGSGSAAYFANIAQRHVDMGFTEFKIKITGDPAVDYPNLLLLQQLRPSMRVRLDANNLWETPEAVVRYCAALPVVVHGLEEPLQGKGLAQLAQLHQDTGIPIILDESFCAFEQLEHIRPYGDALLLNVRVSKVGGILNALAIVEQLKQQNMRVIVGAQVGETSLLTRAALLVAQQLGAHCLAMEGAYGTLLLASDLVAHPLMFEKGGILETSALLQPAEKGWQLRFEPSVIDAFTFPF
jgi:L-Ala-D/L-Glu epimerase